MWLSWLTLANGVFLLAGMTAEILHHLHETISSAILVIAGLILLLGGAGVLRRSDEKRLKTKGIVGMSWLPERILYPCRLIDTIHSIASATQTLSQLLYEYAELATIDRFNYALGEALSDICTRLRLRLDIVSDYYVAVAWFVGGALVSLIMLLLA